MNSTETNNMDSATSDSVHSAVPSVVSSSILGRSLLACVNYTLLIHVFTEVVLFSVSMYFVYNKFSAVNERIQLLEDRIKVLEQKGNAQVPIPQYEQKMSEIFNYYKNELNKQGTSIILKLSTTGGMAGGVVPPAPWVTVPSYGLSATITPQGSVVGGSFPVPPEKGFVQEISDNDDDLDNALKQELEELN